tara:strand:- start:998 stop:1399 length:402 start_codon:yes stop_codon:yes gene_type:complete
MNSLNMSQYSTPTEHNCTSTITAVAQYTSPLGWHDPQIPSAPKIEKITIFEFKGLGTPATNEMNEGSLLPTKHLVVVEPNPFNNGTDSDTTVLVAFLCFLFFCCFSSPKKHNGKFAAGERRISQRLRNKGRSK